MFGAKVASSGIEVGRAGAERDQRVHVGRAAFERAEAEHEEAAAGDGQHESGERGGQQHQGLVAQRVLAPQGETRRQVRAHFQRDHGGGAGGGEPEIAFEPGGVLFAVGERVALRLDRGGFVVFRADGGGQRGVIHRAREGLDGRAMGGEVGVGREHAGEFFQRLLDMGDAGAAHHAVHADLEFFCAGFVALLFHALRQRGEVGAGGEIEFGALRGEVYAGVEDAGGGFQRLFDVGDARCAGHAADFERAGRRFRLDVHGLHIGFARVDFQWKSVRSGFCARGVQPFAAARLGVRVERDVGDDSRAVGAGLKTFLGALGGQAADGDQRQGADFLRQSASLSKPCGDHGIFFRRVGKIGPSAM